MSMRTAEATNYVMPSRDLGMQGEPDLEAGDSFSVIDRFSNFDGTFHSNRDLRIEGEVKGTIECQGTLHIAQGATVAAKVEAEHITVAGDLNGDIRCRGRFQIMPSGRVRGKVGTETLVVNEGAFYEGQLDMVSPDQRLAAPAGGRRGTVGGGSGPVPISGSGGDSRPSRPNAAAPAEGGNGGSNTFIRRMGGPETPWETRQRNGEAAPAGPPPE